MNVYLVVEDFVRASIGPFPGVAEAHAHHLWVNELTGSSATFISIRNDLDPDADIHITPAEDCEWTYALAES